jgi:hypothetical protein
MNPGIARERRWIVLGEDGRHVNARPHTDPTADEVARAGDYARPGLGGWLAVMEAGPAFGRDAGEPASTVESIIRLF